MKFTAEFIFPAGSQPEDIGGANVARLARAAEAAGFDAVSFNDHPAPSRKWLAAGGHDAHDPIAILAYCAAATERIRLIPYQLVLSYRNPFGVAKSFASLDVLSGGRAVASVCVGYLRSEFAAMGVPFEERNDRFDEALAVMKAVWTQESVSSQGLAHHAIDQVSTPLPQQRPHPPIWIGGNSRRSRERVAQIAQGWAPILNTEVGARTTRTAHLETVEDLARAWDEIREMAGAAGRDPASLELQANAGRYANGVPGEVLPFIESLEKVGVTQYLEPFEVGGPERERPLERIERFGREVIAARG